MDNTASLEKVIKGGDFAKDQEGIIAIMQEVGALQEGHFELSSGLHSKQYMQCQKILQYPRYGKVLARAIAEKVSKAGFKIQAVVGPALGAVHLELLVASALDEMSDTPVRGIFAERKQGSDVFAIRRGIEIKPDEQILVVEDVTTTGASAAKVMNLVKELGGNPVAVATIVDRGAPKGVFGSLPLVSLVSVKIEAYEPSKCPLCQEKLPVVKPGTTERK
jgi:orotate phosphoribosyltransferase